MQRRCEPWTGRVWAAGPGWFLGKIWGLQPMNRRFPKVFRARKKGRFTENQKAAPKSQGGRKSPWMIGKMMVNYGISGISGHWIAWELGFPPALFRASLTSCSHVLRIIRKIGTLRQRTGRTGRSSRWGPMDLETKLEPSGFSCEKKYSTAGHRGVNRTFF